MQQFSVSPRELIASFWRNRELTLALTRREVLGRYRGSALGILWSFVNPLFVRDFQINNHANAGSGQ
jgi:lipopolysaccharide transport system permease protein